MIDIQDFETKEVKNALKRIVAETLVELTEEAQPPDKTAILLYQLIGDFREFKLIVDRKHDQMVVKDDIKDMVTKDDLKTAIKDMVTKDDIKDMVTKADIKDMVTKADIKDMLTKADIKDLVASIGIGVRKIIKEEQEKDKNRPSHESE